MYPKHIEDIIRRLENSGESAYIVGGSLRDTLLGKTPHDYDVATSALPEKTVEIFSDKRVIETGIKHGTVTLIWDGEPVEITTFRVDGSYTDSRHPDAVSFTSDIVADLSRRDFTVNAMAYNKKDGLKDPFGGAEDIGAKIIRAVGDPEDRFSEDALRIMRAFRFCAQLGFEIDGATLDGAVNAKNGLANIARERIGQEFLRLITSPYAGKALGIMADTGVLEYVLGTHRLSRKVIENIDGMPFEDTARLGFVLYGADRDTAAEILRGLRLSSKQITGALATLTGCSVEVRSPEDARRLIAKTGIYARAAACGSCLLGVSPDGAEEIVIRQQSTPCSLKKLKINGKALAEMGARGKLIGEVLDALMERVIEQPALNDEQILRDLAKKMIDERGAED